MRCLPTYVFGKPMIWCVATALAFFMPPLLHPPVVHAAVSGCTGTVDPTSLSVSNTEEVTFNIQNDDSGNAAVWVKITPPSSDYTLTESSSGWTSAVSGNAITFTDGSIGAGTSVGFSVSLTTGSSNASSASWTVQLSDDAGGADPVSCTGSLATSITGSQLGITSVSVTNVSTTTVTITWTTSAAANSSVHYWPTSGTEEANGTTTSDSSLVTSHSVGLSGLSTNTSYTYHVVSVDAQSRSAQSNDGTFTTASGSVLITNTPGPAAPTATPIYRKAADTTAPVISFATVLTNPYKEAPQIVGNAIDDTGVTSAEYTLNNGKTWYSIQSLKSVTVTNTEFSFTPKKLAAGSYQIKVRAKDAANNTGTSTSVALTIDTTPPLVGFTTDVAKPFSERPTLKGTAVEASGESTVQYSLDGVNWQAVDSVDVINATTTGFTFGPSVSDDGNYTMYARATDSLGNTSEAVSIQFVIDRLPPRIGGVAVLIGAITLAPNTEGVITTITELNQKITLSAVGGPIETTVIIQKSGDTQGENNQRVSLSKNSVGLWSGTFQIHSPGEYELLVYARDGAGNEVRTQTGKLLVLPGGQIVRETGDGIEEATVTLFTFDETTGTYEAWDAVGYSEENPQKTQVGGAYALYVPEGVYYLEVRARGRRLTRSTIFSVSKPSPIVYRLTLDPAREVRFGFFTFTIPPFVKTVPVDVQEQHKGGDVGAIRDYSQESISLSDTSILPLSTIRGKPTLLCFVSTWYPQTTAQIALLESLKKSHPELQIILVFTQETKSRADLYMKRANVTLPFVADPDGVLADTRAIHSLPTHYFLDRSAHIVADLTGVHTDKELYKHMIR